MKELMQGLPPGARPSVLVQPPHLPARDAAGEVEQPQAFDRWFHAAIGQATGGLSPAALFLAYADWAMHLMVSPAKCWRLAEKGVKKGARLAHYASRASTEPGCHPCITPLLQDRRFRNPLWHQWPFNVIHQGFLLQQQWWHNATTGIDGVAPHHEQVVTFVARQWLDMISPVNFLATNPEVLARTQQEMGANLLRGAMHWWQDAFRAASELAPIGTEAFRPGQEVAATPGQVVLRNGLMELIQYSPATPSVYPEPVLIVPAWIMKYYILDLSPQNSLVRYLVQNGHTVFMISWHNPGKEDRDLGLDDYLHLGLFKAIDAVRTIVPDQPVHALGYCLGGTLLAMGAAYLAQAGKAEQFASLTLLAAQTDFSEAGELTLFVDDSALDMLEDMMWTRGFLDTRQMAGAFQLLRSQDLIWSRLVREYLLGDRQAMTDLLAWNADATRMPYRMHSEYLRKLYQGNALFAGRYRIDGMTLDLDDIHKPMFVVSTERDHVAPWPSVYQIHLLRNAELSFVLTSGGHNAGIVNPPELSKHHYRLARRAPGTPFVPAEAWFAETPIQEGSWWPAWRQWLEAHSSAQRAAPPMGAPEVGYPPLGPAPGRYVDEH